MIYGWETTEHLASLDSGTIFQDSTEWESDMFTVPFNERLIEMISEYRDLPAGFFERRVHAEEMIMEGAKIKNINISRTTLGEWLDGIRDPSVTSAETPTRENIYKLAAALDFDCELTSELFEKVFFTRAFNPKNLREISYYYFANKGFKEGVFDASWYIWGDTVATAIEQTSPESESHNSISNSTLILDAADYMMEQEFIAFIKENSLSFSKENQSMAAKALVREYAVECSGSEDVAYDALITEIIGHSQRESDSAVGPISSLRSLPPQLTANFPSGFTLRKIMLNQEDSYDKINKMLILLLFYAYHKNEAEHVPVKSRFLDFLTYANHELESVGFINLYPHQPYCGLILSCAAQKKPIDALREFVRKAVSSESEAIIFGRLKAVYTKADELDLRRVASEVDGSLFLTDMICRNSAITDIDDVTGDSEELLTHIFDSSCFSQREKELLNYLTLLPPGGIEKNMFNKIFCDYPEEISRLSASGWLTESQKTFSMDYRCRNSIYNSDLRDFPKWENCSSFVSELFEKFKTSVDADKKQLSGMLRRASHLDGIPPEKKKEIVQLVKKQ